MEKRAAVPSPIQVHRDPRNCNSMPKAMSDPDLHDFSLAPRPKKDNGEDRRVGFELEFSGINLDQTVAVLESTLGAQVVSRSAAEVELEVEGLGRFNVEIDWGFLKRKAAESGEEHSEQDWLELLSQVAALLVPVEVVCPPIPMSRLAILSPVINGLREAGAVGTEETLVAAYGVHINTEIAGLDAEILSPYLQAFALLQWWLVDTQEIDPARRISPYIDLYPEAYLKQLLSRPKPTMDQIFDDYLEHNPTRNRALDLLPMLAEIDAARVGRIVDDPRIKARPAFHYRLPDCRIEHRDWSLQPAWNSWLAVEKLADREQDRGYLARRFFEADRPLIGVSRKGWVEFMDQWLHEHGLV